MLQPMNQAAPCTRVVRGGRGTVEWWGRDFGMFAL
jgi:hypothetical protein